MRDSGSFFVAVCIALISLSAGAVLHFSAGYSALEAAMAALAVLFALTAYRAFALRARDRRETADRFEELARAAASIAREVGGVHRRLSALEAAPAADLRAAVEPLARELDAIRKRVERSAESVPAGDARATGPAAAPDAAKPMGGPFAGHSEAETKRLVREAIEGGRVDLYLQPVVTLPQRKVRFYEALARLKLADGSLVEPEHFFGPARALGLMPKLDQRMLGHCVNVVRRLAAKNREVGMFMNIAPETLADAGTIAELLDLLEANRALAPAIVIEVSQSAFRALGQTGQESLAAFAERGFRFALDRVEDLRIDPRALAERGVRFVKIPSDLMLQRGRPGLPFHPADMADRLGRHGIDLIVMRIEREGTVVDLLDYDVRYGQGFLFAPPRPVRAEVLGGGRGDEPEDVEAATATPAAKPSKEQAPATVSAAPPDRVA